MPSLETEVSHDLAMDEAVRRVRGLLTRLRMQYAGKITNVDEWWTGSSGGFTFSLSGMRIKGETDVQSNRVRVQLVLPFAASFFKSAIEKTVRDELIACLRGE